MATMTKISPFAGGPAYREVGIRAVHLSWHDAKSGRT